LCPEEPALGALDDLLVDGLRRVIHHHGAGLVVDLGVDAGVADKVDDPLLAFVLGEAEAGGEVPGGGLVGKFNYCINAVAYLMSILW
jgi:hypothetical protein